MKNQTGPVGGPVELGDFRQVRLQWAARRRCTHHVDVLGPGAVANACPYRDERTIGGEGDGSQSRIAHIVNLPVGEVAVAVASDLGQPRVQVSVAISEKRDESAVARYGGCLFRPLE